MNLILGGTHGLGQELAAAYQAAGEETFVTGRSYDPEEHGPGMRIDLADPEEVERLTRHIEKEVAVNGLHRFFWVAGYGYVGDFADQPEPAKMAAVNFGNPLPAVQAAWAHLLESGKPGNFVVVSSTSGSKDRKDEAVYVGTKHAQVGFARSLGLESERLDSKVRVALFNPSGMRTPFWDGYDHTDHMDFLDPAKVAAKMIERIAEQDEPFYEETFERGSL